MSLAEAVKTGLTVADVEARLLAYWQVTKHMIDVWELPAVSTTGDAEERIREVVDQDQALAALQQLQTKLRIIGLALSRARLGQYGVCVDCHERISDQRLIAVPWVELCLGCQTEAELVPVALRA